MFTDQCTHTSFASGKGNHLTSLSIRLIVKGNKKKTGSNEQEIKNTDLKKGYGCNKVFLMRDLLIPLQPNSKTRRGSNRIDKDELTSTDGQLLGSVFLL